MTTVTFFFLFVLAVLFSKIAAHKCYQNEEATPKAGADDECSAGHEYCAVFRCDKKLVRGCSHSDDCYTLMTMARGKCGSAECSIYGGRDYAEPGGDGIGAVGVFS